MPSDRCSGRHRRRAPRRAARILACAVLLVFAAGVATAQERESAGRIKISSGSVFIVRANKTMPAKAGQDVYEADTLKTGADGSVGITLKDDTRLSLGPNSEIRLDRFAFAPAEGNLGFVLKVVRGVAAYVSGRIAKIAPDAVRLETPSAIVGVRGTTLVLRAQQARSELRPGPPPSREAPRRAAGALAEAGRLGRSRAPHASAFARTNPGALRRDLAVACRSNPATSGGGPRLTLAGAPCAPRPLCGSL